MAKKRESPGTGLFDRWRLAFRRIFKSEDTGRASEPDSFEVADLAPRSAVPMSEDLIFPASDARYLHDVSVSKGDECGCCGDKESKILRPDGGADEKAEESDD